MFDPLVAERIATEQERKGHLTDAISKAVEAISKQDARPGEAIIVCPVGTVKPETVGLIKDVVRDHHVYAVVVTEMPSPEYCKNHKVLVVQDTSDLPMQELPQIPDFEEVLRKSAEIEELVDDKQQRHRERQYQKEQNKLRARFYRR
jgi:hypothetical protein